MSDEVAVLLGIGSVLAVLGLLLLLIFRPPWFEKLGDRVEVPYQRHEKRQHAYQLWWMNRATDVLGESRMKKLSWLMIGALLVGLVVSFVLFFSPSESTSRDAALAIAAVTTVAVYVVMLRIDAAAYHSQRPWMVPVSWAAAAIAIIGFALWELLDPTEEESLGEGFLRTLVIGAPAVTFLACRWKLRRDGDCSNG